MTKKIKIAFIISNLGQGGAEKQFVELISNLDRTKFKITVFLYARQVDPFYKDLEKIEDIEYIHSVLNYNFKFIKIGEALISIRKFLNSNLYDLVVTTLFMNNFLVRLAAPNFYRMKIISNIRTSLKMYNKKLIWAEKIQIRSSHLVFNSKKTHDEFTVFLPRRFHPHLNYIYNGFSIPDDNGIDNSQLLFGSLGRLSQEKNIIQSVYVFSEFSKQYPKAKYVIQGHFGNQYTKIKGAITSSQIEIKEKNPNIECFFNSINILILPSIFEGCPNVLFEALLRKKLCIVSSGANSDNFILDGVNGFVYDGSDLGLLQKMEAAKNLLNTTQFDSIVEAGYLYAANNFSISSMIVKYENLFLRIYEENKSRN